MTTRRLWLEHLEGRQLLAPFAGPGPGRPNRHDRPPDRAERVEVVRPRQEQAAPAEEASTAEVTFIPEVVTLAGRPRSPTVPTPARTLAPAPALVVDPTPGPTRTPAMLTPAGGAGGPLPALLLLPFCGGAGEAAPAEPAEPPVPSEESPEVALPGPEAAGLIDRVVTDLDAVFRSLAEFGPGDPAAAWRDAAWVFWVLSAAGACAAARTRRDRELTLEVER
ncbi:MAG: hypothetical protein ACRC33_04970 [Gemmataceae bacterium]